MQQRTNELWLSAAYGILQPTDLAFFGGIQSEGSSSESEEVPDEVDDGFVEPILPTEDDLHDVTLRNLGIL